MLVAEWTRADVAQWASDYNLLCNDDGRSKLQNYDITGEVLSTFNESAIKSSGLSTEEARQIFAVAARYMLATNEFSTAIIMNNVQTTLARIKNVLENGKNLKYQQENISPLAVDCLLLATDGLYWDTDYFEDIRGTTFYEGFKEQIQGSVASVQNAKLHHLIQSNFTTQIVLFLTVLK